MSTTNIASRVATTISGQRPVAEGSTRPVASSESMLAVVWEGKEQVCLEHVPRPALTHPDDALVKVCTASICSGSDSHVFSGEIPGLQPGQILGHEGLGIVTAVGSGVTKIKVGDRVVLPFCIACGKCEFCQRREYTACDNTNDSRMNLKMAGHVHAAIYGYGDMLGGVPGSQAEYVRVPFADVNCYVVPEEIPDRVAVLLADVLPTSLHAVCMGEVQRGDSVAIWGLGPIGLLAARWCQINGARKVIGIDYIPERLKLARNMLNIDVIDRDNLAFGESVPSTVIKMVPQGVDCAIEAAGFRFSTTLKHKVERALALETDTADLLNECMLSTRKFGRVSVIADYVGHTNHFAIGTLMMKHLTMRSGQCPVQRYLDKLVEHLKKGEMDPSFIITNEISLKQVPEFYNKLYNKLEGAIKVIIKVCDH